MNDSNYFPETIKKYEEYIEELGLLERPDVDEIVYEIESEIISENHKLGIQSSFIEEYKQMEQINLTTPLFSDFESYRSGYIIWLESFQKTYPDAEVMDFIKLQYALIHEKIRFEDFIRDTVEFRKTEFSRRKKIRFLQEQAQGLGYYIDYEMDSFGDWNLVVSSIHLNIGENWKSTSENKITDTTQNKEPQNDFDNYNKKDETENSSESFHLFDRVRHGEVNDYDLVTLLRDYSKNYDLELLKSISKDVSYYLFLEKQNKESEYSEEEIEKAVSERKKKGCEIPYIKIKKPDKDNLTPAQQEQIEPLNFGDKRTILNMEALLFPYEFYNVYRLQEKVEEKIIELEKAPKPDEKKTSPLHWNGTQTELMELAKALIENGSIKDAKKKGKQKELITALSDIFNFPIKNPDKLISDIKNRNIGSETLYLKKLADSLKAYITNENTRKG